MYLKVEINTIAFFLGILMVVGFMSTFISLDTTNDQRKGLRRYAIRVKREYKSSLN